MSAALRYWKPGDPVWPQQRGFRAILEEVHEPGDDHSTCWCALQDAVTVNACAFNPMYRWQPGDPIARFDR